MHFDPSSTTMLEERITLPADASYPFHITAKRYSPPQSQSEPAHLGALTLVVLHSTSFHKETWEPSLAQLFKLASESVVGSGKGLASHGSGRAFKIRDAWAVECPNHGESGCMNKEVLSRKEGRHYFCCSKYAEAVHRFLSAGPSHGAKVDFRKRRLLGIGHSLGANAMILLQNLQPSIPFQCLIIVEPLISPGGKTHLECLRKKLVNSAETRTTHWADREAASEGIRTTYKKWDKRILDTFINHAIRSYPNRGDGVFLACSREQEVIMYNDADGPVKPVDVLRELCTRTEVHLILGEKHDFIPAHVQADIRNLGSYASWRMMKKVGHLIPQERPDELGAAIYDILRAGGGTRLPPLPRL